MGRVLAGLALMVVVLLALDFAGIVPLVLSKKDAADSEGGDGITGDEADGETVALRGTGGDPVAEEEDTPPPVEEPVDLSEVRGTTVNGGVVRGRVVQGTPPLPVSGVRVTLARPDSIFSYLRAKVNGRFDQLEATTNDEGRFTFLDVTPSKGYVVRAHHPEFAVASSPRMAPGQFQIPRIDLRGGGERDLGDIALGKGGQIEGRVLDPRGDPVPHAHVFVTWVVQNALNSIVTEPSVAPETERDTHTDENGKFRMEHLEPGWKTVIVVAPNGASDAHPRLRIDDGKTFDVGDWQLKGTHFIGGRVVWSDGKPVANTRVVAAPFGNPVGRQTLTDADGRFRLDHLPEASNYAIGSMVPGLPVALELKVKLDSDEHEIRIATPARLQGRVIDATTKKPVTRFRILTSQKPTGNWLPDMIAKQVTLALGATPFEDPDGRFEFERMPVGSFTLEFTAAGHPPYKQELTVAVGDNKELVVELPSGKQATGHVLGADGAPVSGARVFVLPGGEVDKLDLRGLERALKQRMPGGTTDEQGAFALPAQSPGSYDLVADADGKRPGVLKNASLGQADVEGLELRMPPSARIAGRLVGPQGQALADEVQVVAIFSDLSWNLVDTDERGRFAFDAVPVGRVLLRWRFEVDNSVFAALQQGNDEKAREAYEKLKIQTEEHALRNGQTLNAEVTIPRRTLVTGRVMSGGAVAKKVRGVYFLKQPEGQRWQYSQCDLGRFTHRLVPGIYLAYIPASTGDWIPQRVEIPDLSEHDMELEQPLDENADRGG